eukprot:CAMPEP_0184017714 /NCGR_PEP_ID=MMETSP0954-20121128/7709_1 /TAXON_ID=627963 /ORGANISM="Aplanochytrium sp, Strain PBS07" /LENGTH=237 /DNA_ID=CAMNT_0026299019 /DNA_START=94 /DNA_END=807 /DNA_ORIENTATION=-
MSDNFSKSVLKVTTARICRRQGIESAEEHAFETLVDVVGKYIETIGLLTKTYAEHDGRTKGNLLDLLQTFNTLEPKPVRWKDLITMADMAMWEIAFPSGVPEYPVEPKRYKKMKMYGSQTSSSEQELPPYVPSFLPRFPEPHAYKVTLVNATTPVEDPKEIVERSLAERVLVQTALAKINKGMRRKGHQFGVMNEAKLDAEDTSNADVHKKHENTSKESTSNITAAFSTPKPADAFL